MRDLKLRNFFEMQIEWAPKTSLASPACAKVAEQFKYNMAAARSIIEAPIFAAYTADCNAGAYEAAARLIFGKSIPNDIPDDTRKLVNSLYLKLRTERLKEANSNKQMLGIFVDLLDDFITEAQSAEVVANFENIMRSSLIQTWTAFEVMAGDLWESAMNENPFILAKLSKPKKGPQMEESQRIVKLWEIERHGFDIANKMGTILREKFNFQTLESMRVAYALAFSIDQDKVMAAISASSITALCLLRNLLVHKAGVIDARFYEGSKFIQELSAIRSGGIGATIVLDGEFTKNMLTSVAQKSVDLLCATDEWLSNHSKK